jgi:hypothetical protein
LSNGSINGWISANDRQTPFPGDHSCVLSYCEGDIGLFTKFTIRAPHFITVDYSMRVSLSAKGMQQVRGVSHENDFDFIVGDQRYSCPSFIAEFLSPRISALRSQDITIDYFSIQTEDPIHCFPSLLSIGFGREVSLSDTELASVRPICGELWNHELFESTLKRHEEIGQSDEAKARLDFLRGDDGSLQDEVGKIASRFYSLSISDFHQVSLSLLESILSPPKLVIDDEDSLFELLYGLAWEDPSYFGLLEFVRFEFLSKEWMTEVLELISSSFESVSFGIWSSLQSRLALSVALPSQGDRVRSLPVMSSKIVSEIPELFSVFGDQRFRLLWRGSRHGFRAANFHERCDGHPNTVTLILSDNGCVFGGYTPVAWNSRSLYVSDPSLESFLFTLQNPHNLPPRIFKQKDENGAICCDAFGGPTFGHWALRVCDDGQMSNGNFSDLGNGYVNDTGIEDVAVLTGEKHFIVDEIEVFEVGSKQ